MASLVTGRIHSEYRSPRSWVCFRLDGCSRPRRPRPCACEGVKKPNYPRV